MSGTARGRRWRAAGRRCAAVLLALAAALAPVVAAGETPLPPERLRDSGLEALSGGRLLTAYARLAQYLERAPDAPDRAAVEARAAEARAALLAAAPRGSLLVASIEQMADGERPPGRAVARLAARAGRVTVEATGGPGVRRPAWERAGLVPADAYAALVDRLLQGRVFRVHVPGQALDPNLPGPRRAASLRLVVGDDAWEVHGLRGEPWETVSAAAALVLDFARSTAVEPLPGAARP